MDGKDTKVFRVCKEETIIFLLNVTLNNTRLYLPIFIDMNRTFRILSIIILSLGALFIIATISVNYIIKNKIENFINTRLPDNILQSYKDLTVQTFEGSIIISEAAVILTNKNDTLKHTFIQVETLKISDISYWDYLVNDKIHIETILLERPKIAYHKDRLKHSQDTLRKPLMRLYKSVFVDNLEINDGNFAMYEKEKDSTILLAKHISLKVRDIELDNATLSRKLPIQFKEYAAEGDSIFVKVSPYENLTVNHFNIKDKKATFSTFQLKTKYSRSQLSQIIRKERDHYNLQIEELSIANIDFGFIFNDKFFAKSDLVIVNSPDLDIYRDKLVADDPTFKPLYSKMLRDLPFEMTVDSLKILNGLIKYSEKVKTENNGGSINFSNLNAAISNVSNTYVEPVKTEAHINAHFMEKTPFSVDWSFDVQNPNDQFLFKADVGALRAEKMNSFTQPNLRVKLEGNTNKTFFTIDGGNNTSVTDMKINYTDFKVTVLNKDGENKNRLLSTIANIFISKDSQKKNDFYREGTAEATRDKSKSFFNYLWISVKNALIKSLTGKNKKD